MNEWMNEIKWASEIHLSFKVRGDVIWNCQTLYYLKLFIETLYVSVYKYKCFLSFMDVFSSKFFEDQTDLLTFHKNQFRGIFKLNHRKTDKQTDKLPTFFYWQWFGFKSER